MYYVKDLYKKESSRLSLELVSGKQGLDRPIRVPESHRPGLSLSGYLKSHAEKRILIFGKVEIEYLRDLDSKTCIQRLEAILTPSTPAVIIARRYAPPKELKDLCDKHQLPLFKTQLSTMNLHNALTVVLNDVFAPKVSFHGTLVEVFGVGVLIKGDSGIGKSEAALGLIERGHSLVSDDIVQIKKRDGAYLEGFGANLTRHHMEIRGIGIINVALLYGPICVLTRKKIDIVVHLETWNPDYFYDRIGTEKKVTTILGVELPFSILPVKLGRDLVLLLETIALNHRLKEMGYNAAEEFTAKVSELTSLKSRRRSLSDISKGVRDDQN
jgi:HPr kinase/phosphorylase